MSKRYGRNQRRKHREEIDALQRAVNDTEAQNNTLRFNQHRAVERAFDSLMEDSGRIDALMEMMTVELARKFGDELMPVVQQVISSRQERRPIIDFNASVPYDQTVETIRIHGVIPELHYNMVVMR